MRDNGITKDQLVQEVEDLRRRIAELEKFETDPKWAKGFQRESEEKFFLAFKHAPLMAAITVLEDGTYLEVNDRFMDVGGFRREEVLGKTSIELGWLRGEDRQRVIEAIQRQDKVSGLEITSYAKDGRPIDCLYYFELVTIGGVKRLLTMVLDITESKRTKVALQQAHDELEQRVAARTEELRQANKELQTEIAARKRVEQSLREHEYRLRLITDNIPAHVCYLNQNRCYSFVNRYYAESYGLPKEAFIGKSYRDMVDEDYYLENHENVELAFSGRLISFEAPIFLPNADKRWVMVNYVPDYDPQGNVHGIFVLRYDITERKMAEAGLQRLAAIVESSDDAIFSKDLEGIILSWNKGAERIYGYSIEEIIGNHISVLFPPGYPEEVSQFLKTFAQGESIDHYETVCIRKDGVLIDISLTLSPVKDATGRIVGAATIARDITERKRVEVALSKSEEKYRTIIENMEEGYHEVDLMGNFTLFNESARKMTGYEREELLGMNYRSYADEGNIRKIYPIYNQVYRTGEPVKNFEWQIIRKDGALRDIEVSLSLIRNVEGHPTGFRGIVRDITDRKQAEKLREELEARLRRAEKMEALGTLAGGVAHDLNNVLGVIVGFSELLLYDVEESSPLRPGLVNILGGSQRAAAIVQDLLTLARRGVSDRYVLNLNKIIVDGQNSAEFKNLSAYHSSVKVKTDLEPDLLNISGSSVHLSKTLFNLVSNASESMPKGGTLTIKTSNQYLDRAIQGYDEVREGDYVVLSVSDTGEGITADDLKRIFEPFYTKKVMGRSGTGLGLAVVWGTVKDHHGYINVQSEEGKGSTFTLYFPVTRGEITAEDVALPLSEYLGKGETILIVDDVKGQRDLAEEMLKKLNYHITSVSSGEDAVVYLKEQKVDLLVLDMIMDPGMDGLDTYKKILEIHPRQKAIIVSGFSESERVKAAQSLGAGAYVKKPYIREKLGLAVRKELDRIK
ncbi:MAG: PAS domain S-box protein [Deltaproteobacteria bacterium]|nr:PAS domain S-box protein [Deltaproteobacteria bacterium]